MFQLYQDANPAKKGLICHLKKSTLQRNSHFKASSNLPHQLNQSQDLFRHFCVFENLTSFLVSFHTWDVEVLHRGVAPVPRHTLGVETLQVVLSGVHGSTLGTQVVHVGQWGRHILENQLENKSNKYNITVPSECTDIGNIITDVCIWACVTDDTLSLILGNKVQAQSKRFLANLILYW